MLQKIWFVFFFFDKKDPKLSLSELLSMMTRIQFNLTLFISMPTGFFIWGYMYPFTFIFGGPMYPLTLHLGVQRKWTAFCSFHMSSFCICFFFFLSIWNKISICCCFECIIWTVIFWCLKEIKTLAHWH